jgi:hypothetical protein
MSDFGDWGLMFLGIGVLTLVFMIYVPALMMARNPFSGNGVMRHGLNELLDSYQRARSKQAAMMFSPLLICPGLFFARDPVSFFVCMALLVIGSLLARRSFSAGRSLSADYRKEAANLVTGGGKNALTVLDKLDGEVRRGEAILRSENEYYVFPSAVVADKGGSYIRPWIVPTGIVKSMIYSLFRGHSKRRHCVYLYDERGSPLCVLRGLKKQDASALMSELNRRFGIREEAIPA